MTSDPLDQYPGPDAVAWESWTIGTRVSVRFRDAGRARDALGDLVASGDGALVIETRRGPVRVPVADILVGRRVPPPPPRREPGPRYQTP
jgi:hypothetical protein